MTEKVCFTKLKIGRTFARPRCRRRQKAEKNDVRILGNGRWKRRGLEAPDDAATAAAAASKACPNPGEENGRSAEEGDRSGA